MALFHKLYAVNGYDAAHFETATNRWEEVKNRLFHDVRIENAIRIRHGVREFVKHWGPHPEALYFGSRLCLSPYPDDPVFSTDWVALHLRLFPQHPGAYENAADFALERGDCLQALAIAERGLRVDPAYQGLVNTRLEVLASLGRYDEAESAMLAAIEVNPMTPRFFLIRGLMRAGRRKDAMAQVRQWVQLDGRPAAVARNIAALPLTAPLINDADLRVPEFARVPLGIDGELQGIVEEYLHADGVKFFLGELPPEKQQNTREGFLQLQPGELMLFYYDWSFWQNAKTGFVITNQRVLWKCLWADPVVIALTRTPFQNVAVNKSVLQVGDRSVDIEDEDLATTFAYVLREICVALNNPPSRDRPTKM